MSNHSAKRRRLLLLSLLIGSMSLLPLSAIGEDEPYRPAATEWRRTIHGWESTRDWFPPRPAFGGFHPVTVAALIGLVSIGALMAFDPRQ